MLFQYLITSSVFHRNPGQYQICEMEADEFVRVSMDTGIVPGPKAGKCIVGAALKPGGRIEGADVIAATALILDIDSKKDVADPDEILPLLPWRGIAHTSHSHTPEVPKFRVILPLAEPISPEEHHRLWAWMNERVGHALDPSGKNVDHLFFTPRASPEALNAGWPWIKELKGPLLSIRDVPASFAPTESFVSQGGPPKRKQGAHPADPETRYSHVDWEVTLEKFKELSIVQWAKEHPSDVSREVWRGLATNLAAIVNDNQGDEDIYDACLTAFHELSEPDPVRYDEGATSRMFANAMKSAPMKYETMQKNGAPAAVCPPEHTNPVVEARRLARREAPRDPKAHTPAPQTPSTTPTATGNVSPPQNTAVETEELDPEDPSTIALNCAYKEEDFLYDAVVEKYRRVDKDGDWTKALYSLQSLNQLLMYGGLLQPKYRDLWRSRVRSVEVHDVFFDHPGEVVVKIGELNYFNSYTPTKLEPVAGTWDDIRYVLLNLCGGDNAGYEWLLDWLAAPLQALRGTWDAKENKYVGQRSKKMGTAVVLQGEHGSGKNTLNDIMALIYGESNAMVIDQGSLDGHFNDEIADKLFVTANEIMSSTNRSMETANKLKMWITDPDILIEGKFRGKQKRKNHFNIVFLANEDRPIIIEKGDRRYVVFHSKTIDPAIGAKVHDDISGPKDQVRAFYDFLLKRQVKITYGTLHKTEARQEMISASMKSEEKFVEDLQEQAWHALAEPWLAAGNPNNPRVAVVANDGIRPPTLQEVYQDYCKRNGLKPCGWRTVLKHLKAAFPKMTEKAVWLGGVTTKVYFGIPLHPMGVVLDFPSPQKPEDPPKKSEAGDFTP